jgi:3-hydroxyisobutyrate dehydrogenase-like beta-hydroxyacid dehydrogenase
MNLVSNLLLITGVTALTEAIATARGQGVTDDLPRTVFGNSGVLSPASRMRLDSPHIGACGKASPIHANCS